MNLDFHSKFKDVIEKIGTIGEQYSEARGQSYQMQELKGSMLASLMNKIPDIPVSKAEIQAKASEDYQNYIKGTAEAIKKELRLKAQYEKYKCMFEALRSLCSLDKSTQKEIG